MKVSVTFLVFICFISSFQIASGQNNQVMPGQSNMETKIEEQVDKLGEELELDNLQKALLKANLKEYNSKALKLLKSDGSEAELKDSMENLKKQQRKDLNVFLSEEQIKVFEKFQKREQKRNRSVLRRQRIRY